MNDLRSTVALVTGASRGAGRGIACVLGEHGATVYVTGRSTGKSTTEGLPGTVEETAEMVTKRGGRGIAVVCDHTQDAAVKQLFGSIKGQAGKLDLLVNNVWGGYEHYDHKEFPAKFWEQPLRRWPEMFTAGVRAHIIASKHAAPMMIDQKHGIIISTIAWDQNKYLGNLWYDVAKHAIARAMWGMARELKPHGVAAIALAPGFMRTERVKAAVGNDPNFNWDQTETPEYCGRAVAALATDPKIMAKTGQTLRVGDLAKEYGFTDIDGRLVPPFELPPEYGN